MSQAFFSLLGDIAVAEAATFAPSKRTCKQKGLEPYQAKNKYILDCLVYHYIYIYKTLTCILIKQYIYV
jgi:hypothetical protein